MGEIADYYRDTGKEWEEEYIKVPTHITKEGKEIPLINLTDSHLKNIIAYNIRRAEEGISKISGGGGDGYDMWCDVDTLYDKSALREMGQHYYLKELKRRK